MEKAYKEEDIEKLDGYQQVDFVHPHLKWLNIISRQLGEKSYFNDTVKIEGHNVYHRSGKAVGEPHWYARKDGMNWGWTDGNGFDSGYNSGIETFDALKVFVRDRAEQGDERAKLFIGEWEANFNKW